MQQKRQENQVPTYKNVKNRAGLKCFKVQVEPDRNAQQQYEKSFSKVVRKVAH